MRQFWEMGFDLVKSDNLEEMHHWQQLWRLTLSLG
jgi:hypothetical protein